MRQQFSVSLFAVVLYLVFAASIVGLSIDTIRTSSYENNDIAANSILIQDAKSLRLLEGNYSRVGFNHPGPAFLYVLAAGELLFHDWLNVTSPVGGQIIASGFLAAFWLTLIAVIASYLFPSRMMVILFIAAFMASSIYFDVRYDRTTFGGLWPPFLYCLPFAVYTIALAEISLGRAQSLPIAVIAVGFLVNGHVAFAPICAIMFIVTLMTNQFFVHSFVSSQSRNLCSRELIFENGLRIVVSLGLGVLFVAPLLILTVKEFPGPIADYIGFSGRTGSQEFGASVRYVLSFLGGGGPRWLDC